MRQLRRAFEALGPVSATPAMLEQLADAVHQAACWLPPWPDPMTLVVTAGFELVAHDPGRSVTHSRRVGFVWDADPQVRGLRVLRSFARVLLRDVLQQPEPDEDAALDLTGRLLIPTAMIGAARRDPGQPSLHAPKWFVAHRLSEVSVSKSGTYVALYEK